MAISELVRDVLVPILSEMKISLFDCSFKKEGKDYYLHVYIENEDGRPITLDDIVSVSEAISPKLDESEIINTNYVLDVSSVGAERPIKVEELEKFITRYVNIHVTNPVEGLNTLEGDLIDVKENEITLRVKIKTRTKDYVINKSAIDRARLAIKF